LSLYTLSFFGDHTLFPFAIVMAYLSVLGNLWVPAVPEWKRANPELAEMPHNSAMAV